MYFFHYHFSLREVKRMAGNTLEAHIITQTSKLTVFPCVMKIIREGTSPAHWHNFPQVWFVSKGEITLTVAQETYVAKKGSCIFVPAYMSHAISENKGGVEVFVISFTDAMFGGFDDEYFLAGKHAHINHRLVNIFTELSQTESGEMAQLVGDMRTELLKGRGRNPAMVSLAIITILERMANRRKDRGSHIVEYNRISEMSKIVRYVTENISKKLTIESICEKYNMSQSTFVREFKKATGMSFVQMILSVRVRYACQQLRYTKKKIILIADEMGFYDESHFTHAFSSIIGISPAQYRAEAITPFDDVGFVL